MGISDLIAGFINDAIAEADGMAELQRAELANRFGCVPSQINYVISTRFSPEHGYIVESRRGGGGYIRIVRVQMSKNEYLMHFFQAVGQSVSEAEARAYLQNLLEHGILTEREARLVAQSVSQSALEACPAEKRDNVRADMLRHILMMLMMA